MKKIIQPKDMRYEELIDATTNNDTEEYDNYISGTSVFSLYLKEIAKYPVLTFEEEQELAKQIIDGNEFAKQKFIKSNLRLVVFVAKSFKATTLDFVDLIQEGNLGLLKAVEMFDYTKGFKFSTYAIWWIKRAILKAIYNEDDLIRLPSNIKELVNRYESFQNDFYKNNMRYATDIEVSQKMQISINRVNEIKSVIYSTISLHTPVSCEEESELGDFLADTDLTPEEIVINNSKKDACQELISNSHLTSREELVIKMRFDFNNNDFYTLKDIALKLGITPERVRQIECIAMKKIRNTVKRKYHKEFFM